MVTGEIKKIDKKFFVDLAKEVGLNARHFELLNKRHHWEIDVDGDMLERVIDIQRRFEQLAKMGEREYRGLYFEMPRPEPEEWCDEQKLIASGACRNHEEFIMDWLEVNPMETNWFHVTSLRDGDSRLIYITDLRHIKLLIKNRTSSAIKGTCDEWYQKIYARLFDYLQRLIDAACSNPDGFNDYVEDNLPYQLREGRISQKELYSIAPGLRIKLKDREMSIEALEAAARGRTAPPLETMTIRKYCTYYRIASEEFLAYDSKPGYIGSTYVDPPDVSEDMLDIVRYYQMRYCGEDPDETYNLDSQLDFMRFATDHYGKLGFTRLEVFALYREHRGWMIAVSNSCSDNIGLAIEVATALYKAGVPLVVRDARKLLKILREEDNVKLLPSSYHTHWGHKEESVVYELPWEYECADDGESVLTREQYRAIISHVEWQEVEWIELA